METLFSEDELKNLRNYLIGGGFLHIDDNYGMSPFIRPQLKALFPELELVELPYNHPIFNQNINSGTDYPKFMNMTINLRKLLD